ncbi:MAG TPA: 2,3-bisphosphoglycerate-independent phosphoglycerate mutase [Thermomicrobiales bacterium]|nr:2,3-bisphosphoglycerate-independent phosphoglycerate mutase [Thermomicrobiales bacterium]
MTTPGPVVLVVLDGWGLERPGPGNAIALADTPVFDRLLATYPHTTLKTCGNDVGLPAGQMGNSEVGHLNLGAGFVVFQSITRIDLAIQDGSFFENPVLRFALERAREPGRTLHLLGLVSDGGVHSHLRHLDALLQMCTRQSVDHVAVHAILDGRDTSPTAGAGYLRDVKEMIARNGRGAISSVVGRFFAMDRDRRWERTRSAFELLLRGAGQQEDDLIAAVARRYVDGTTDEFMPPMRAAPTGDEPCVIRDGDIVIYFNFRSDRGRQLTQALIGPEVDGGLFDDRPTDLTFVTLTEYASYLSALVAFEPMNVVYPLARVISEAGLRQFHTAETEKYAHVTYFFNGGREEPFDGEVRALVASPRVTTYDQQPEMSAAGVTDGACLAIAAGEFAFVIINYANCDMVGHTGVIRAAIRATEAVDAGLGRIVEATLDHGGTLLVTADHGNAERMLVPGTNAPMTAHTTNPVPFILVSPEDAPHRHAVLRDGGRLADVAPTVLTFLHIAPPRDMTGVSLIEMRDARRD